MWRRVETYERLVDGTRAAAAADPTDTYKVKAKGRAEDSLRLYHNIAFRCARAVPHMPLRRAVHSCTGEGA